jgi:hypothetical protein
MNGIGSSMMAAQKAEQGQKHSLALVVGAAALLSASPEETDACLEELLQCGEIEFDLLPEDDDIPLEEELDADADFLADDDALQDSARESVDGDDFDEDSPFAQEDHYVIRVVGISDHLIQCIPPTNNWAAAKGVTPKGTMALNTVSKRMQILSQVASWLERRFGERLGLGLASFLDGWVPIEQVLFRKDCGVSASDFTRSIRNVRLAWTEGSVPLYGCIFAARPMKR